MEPASEPNTMRQLFTTLVCAIIDSILLNWSEMGSVEQKRRNIPKRVLECPERCMPGVQCKNAARPSQELGCS